MRADEAIDLVGKRGWNRRSARAGSKGARDYAWAWIATASQHRHLLARRNLKDPTDLAYFSCYSPPQRPPATPATLVRVAGMRWPVEEDFCIGIDHFGLDHSQVRLYTACCATDPDHRRQAVCAVTVAVMRSVTSTLPPPPTSPTETPPPDPEGALAALEQAIGADPVAEELYRRVMRLEAEVGRLDAVRRTYRLLARRLADLDVDPDPETEQLVAELLRRPGA